MENAFFFCVNQVQNPNKQSHEEYIKLYLFQITNIYFIVYVFIKNKCKWCLHLSYTHNYMM